MPLYLGVAAVLALAGALLSAFLLVTAMVCAIAALVSFFRQRG
ncbi:Uncharacterised protein [Bordetella pertussis]|nr:Uncharacterised protein [Bordetella pertussis]